MILDWRNTAGVCMRIFMRANGLAKRLFAVDVETPRLREGNGYQAGEALDVCHPLAGERVRQPAAAARSFE